MLRICPQKSGSHDASIGSEYSVAVMGAVAGLEPNCRAGWRDLVTDGVVVTVGYNWERACLTTARAARKFAAAAATV